MMEGHGFDMSGSENGHNRLMNMVMRHLGSIKYSD